MKPFKAQLKKDGYIEAFDIHGESLPKYEGPYTKQLHDIILRANTAIYLDGFNNPDSRMKGIEIYENLLKEA